MGARHGLHQTKLPSPMRWRERLQLMIGPNYIVIYYFS